jgi:protein-L-isoaspartate(D-aspartate) O-methyltransferase
MIFFRKFRLRAKPARGGGGATLPDEALFQKIHREEYGPQRRIMIERHLWRRGIRDRRVLAAMARVERHRFVSARQRSEAYDDHPLSIGHGQTISQPFVVAKTVELAEIRPGARVLEIGVGCGYQTAVLLALGAEVWGIEIVAALASEARERLAAMGWLGFHVRNGDGWEGWPEAAPFDAVVLAAAPERFPPPLIGQLADGGRLVGPVGPREDQVLVRLMKQGKTVSREEVFPVRYVPMVGRALTEDQGEGDGPGH